MNRRSVLLGSASILAAGALAACANGKDPTAAQIQADIQAIANGFTNFIPALQAAVPGISASVLQQAQTAINTVNTNAQQIAQDVSQGIGVHGFAQALQAIATAASTLSTILTPFFPTAPAIGAVVSAALALVQIVLTAAGVSAASVKTVAPYMNEAAARNFLNSKPLVQ